MKNKDLIQIFTEALDKMKKIDPNADVEIFNLATASIGAKIYEQRTPTQYVGLNVKTYKNPKDTVQVELVCQAWVH